MAADDALDRAAERSPHNIEESRVGSHRRPRKGDVAIESFEKSGDRRVPHQRRICACHKPVHLYAIDGAFITEFGSGDGRTLGIGQFADVGV